MRATKRDWIESVICYQNVQIVRVQFAPKSHPIAQIASPNIANNAEIV